jgi:large subunit ribosomal protein L4
MNADVYNVKNEKVSTMDLPDGLFAAPWRPALVQQVLLAQRANARRPWAHAKDRSEVSGGGKKPWRQKGTGRARHGSIRSPLWSGGGKAHGPSKERDFSQKVNKKMRRAALASVLSKKLRDSEVKVFDSLQVSGPKTKFASEMLRGILNFKKTDKRFDVLLVRDPENKDILRAMRNLQKTQVLSADSLNIQDLLSYKYVFLESKAVPYIHAPGSTDARTESNSETKPEEVVKKAKPKTKAKPKAKAK